MIILINPPNPPGKVSNKDMMGGLGQLYDKSGAKVPPLDLPYTAACLKEKNVTLRIIDCLGLDYDANILLREIKKITREQSATAALRTSLPTYSYDMEIAQKIKEETNASIIIFGPYVSLNPQETIEKDYVDIIVLGEPEYIFVDIFLKGLEETEGIWFKDKKGKIIRNNSRSRIEDLNQLPIPAWELMPYKNYILPKPQFPDESPFLPVLTSRGCPFSCNYCPYPLVQGSKWRNRSPENVIRELEYIVKDLGINNILFRDPEFSLNRERVLKICEEIINRKIKFFWRCETRIDTLDENLITMMAKAGCCGMNLGIESVSEESFHRMGRKVIAQKQCLEIMNLCKKHNISTYCFFIIGLPGENKKEILKTIKFAKSIDPSQVQFTFATPYPGTPLYQWAEENNFIEDRELRHLTGYIPVMRNEYLNVKRLKKLYNFALRFVEMRGTLKKERMKNYGFIQGMKEILKEILFCFKKWII